jgi:hypothetical protein
MSKDSGIVDNISLEQDVRPCKHMEGMVSGYADGSLKGPGRWYTQLHALHCTQCRVAIQHLRVVIDKVSELREDGTPAERLPTDRRAEIDRALDDVDSSTRAKG